MTQNDVQHISQLMFVIVRSTASLSVVGVGVHSYLQRAKRRMLGHAQPEPALGADSRLLRLEQAVDSIAVEVERISEGQRFLTKLQTDQRAERGVLGQ